jgi:hypothetical protein
VGIRQKLNDNPALSIALAVMILLGASAFVGRLLWLGPDDAASEFANKAFFTVDDGEHWFVGDARQIPPFEFEGQTAVRAKVFECADGKKFVGYLERYDAADKKKLEDAAKANGGELHANMLYLSTMEIKKPGDKEWVKNTPPNSQRCQEIMSPKCPDDAAGEPPRQVSPR